MKKIFSFCLLSLCSTILLFAQKRESFYIHKYTTEQGLSSNVVYQLLQDKYGFIWIGTEEGVSKFDGKKFLTFTVKKGRYSLSHNRAQAMIQAPNGNIWIGTSDGLNIYDYVSDSIIKVRTTTSPLKLIYDDITSFALSADKQKIWIGTYGNGVNYFDSKKQRFYALKLPKPGSALSPVNVMCLLDDHQGSLWIGTRHNGLYRYDFRRRQTLYYNLPDEASFIRTIFRDRLNRIWIGTSKGCYLYNNLSDRLEPVNYPSELAKVSIGKIIEDRNNRIWIGSEVFLMNFSELSFSTNNKFPFQVITHGEADSKLSSSSINTLFADRDNNIWIGMAWAGVNMLQGTPPKFKLFKHEAEDPGSYPNAPITSLQCDRNGVLWIATDGMGLYNMNIKNDELRKFVLPGKTTGFIYQVIYIDSHGNKWIGTYNSGLIVQNSNGGKVTHFVYNGKNQNSIPNNDVRCIFESTDGSVWIGTEDGLARFNKEKTGFTRIKLFRNKTAVRSIREDKNGWLWIGTYGAGVICYNPQNNKSNNRPVKARIRVISDILISGDSVWIASQGDGVLLHLIHNKKEIVYQEENGLASNYVRSLLRDRLGRLWMGTSKGISRLTPQTSEIKNYNTQDGVQNRELGERCATILKDGQMAFGGLGGLNIFNPLSVSKNDRCPRVVFTRLSVFNEVVRPSDGKSQKSPLDKNITLADKIVLNYNQSVFTLEFMGINYNAAQKIQYAYLLEGADRKWNKIGNQNSVTYRNLPPGEYLFCVKASSPDAVWSDKNITSIQIVIKPPYWRTWWAYLLYVLTFGILGYFIWQFLTLRIRSRNSLKIERAKREKEMELNQEKLQFFTNISHEFRTPLTLLIGPLEKLLMEETDSGKKMHLRLMLRNSKRLLRMVNQLLDFRKTERGQMQLKVQLTDIIAFIREEMLSFEELRLQKNIRFELIHDEETLTTWFDPEFIDKSLFNLLSNAFKFTPVNGEILVSVMKKADASGTAFVEISVSDSGIGISPNDINNIFERFYQGKEKSGLQRGSGIGLHLTQNLIELHHGTITVESTPNVKTIFTILIPADRHFYPAKERSDEMSVQYANIIHDSLSDLNLDDSISGSMERNEDEQDKNKKRILIVEDNPEIRSYITGILGREYNLEEAENGLIGLEKVRRNEYDLIISDVMMPEMDGIEMCRQIKSSIETNHIPIIMLTAKSEIENKIEGLSIGADSYITKPFHPQHLSIRVNKLIELREILRERYKNIISSESAQVEITQPQTVDDPYLQKMITIVLDKMQDTDFNGDSLAAEMSISRMGLHRKIKALTGQSTGEFIRNIRLKRASELLLEKGRNVSEVCYEVGFNSPSYFTTCFAELFKMPPSEYIRKNQK